MRKPANFPAKRLVQRLRATVAGERMMADGREPQATRDRFERLEGASRMTLASVPGRDLDVEHMGHRYAGLVLDAEPQVASYGIGLRFTNLENVVVLAGATFG